MAGVVADKHDDDRLHRKLRGLEVRLDRRVTIEQVAELHRRPAALALPATINDIDRAELRQQRGWSRVHVADQRSRPEQASLQACQPVEKHREH